MDPSSSGNTKSNNRSKLVIVLLLVALTIFFREPVGNFLKEALDWIEAKGTVGANYFILLYIITTILLVPGSILTLGAGAIYGVFWGTIVVSIASVAGATAAFLIGRNFARDWVNKQIEKQPRFKAVNSAISEEGRNIVFLIRLSPAFPFNFLNYAFGLTKVKLWDYVLASWAGMLPGTVLYVYLGSIAGDVARAEGKSPLEWAFLIIGLLATVGVTIYVTKLAKKSLDKKTDKE